MDSDEVSKQKNNRNNMSDDGDVLPSPGIRRAYNSGYEIDKFLGDYNGYFLPVVSGILWIISLFI